MSLKKLLSLKTRTTSRIFLNIYFWLETEKNPNLMVRKIQIQPQTSRIPGLQVADFLECFHSEYIDFVSAMFKLNSLPHKS